MSTLFLLLALQASDGSAHGESPDRIQVKFTTSMGRTRDFIEERAREELLEEAREQGYRDVRDVTISIVAGWWTAVKAEGTGVK